MAMPHRCDRSERGATLVLFTLLIVAMLLMVAIVLDLAALRQDRRLDRSAADAAATTGATAMGETLNLLAACQSAWQSVGTNLGVLTSGDPCVAQFSGLTCDALTTAPRTASGNIGDYRVDITAPVTDGHRLMRAESPGGDITQSVAPEQDGTDPCTRLGVRIRYTREPLFGRIVNAAARTTDVHSVARAVPVEFPGFDVPALVVLNQTGCRTTNSGTGNIRVQGASAGRFGIMRSDTAASASAAADCVALWAAGGGGGGSGQIKMCGFSVNAADCTEGGQIRHFAPSTPVNRAFGGGGTFAGTFTRVISRFTRAPIDRVYHCSNGPGPGNPCLQDDGSILPDHINVLRSQLQNGPLGGHTTIGPSAADCAPSGPRVYPLSRYFIDCDDYDIQNAVVTFTGPTQIVTKGSVTVRSNGTLNINATSISPYTPLSHDSILYLRSGDITKQSSTANLNLYRTFVHSNAGFDFNAGGLVRWTAPETGSFKDLLYWSESTAPHVFDGGPSLNMSGIMFMGRSLIDIRGSGDLDARRVQFWADSVATQGAATLVLRADPDRAIPDTATTSRLIR